MQDAEGEGGGPNAFEVAVPVERVRHDVDEDGEAQVFKDQQEGGEGAGGEPAGADGGGAEGEDDAVWEFVSTDPVRECNCGGDLPKANNNRPPTVFCRNFATIQIATKITK